MSFRLFIYYCALIGGWSGLIGWALGRVPLLVPARGDDSWLAAMGLGGIRALYLGLVVAFGLCLLDALWSVSLRRYGHIAIRVGIGFLVGAIGGMIGGMVGALLFFWLQSSLMLILGWTLTGLLVGASIGVFEFLSCLVEKRNPGGAQKKLVKCLLGGLAGGIIGGTLAALLRAAWDETNLQFLWSPTALGFVALGMCIGLFVGLAQVILKEAWLKVEAGFRPGREILLAKEKTTIGRAEECDIGLFGDNTIEKCHAHIINAGANYVIEDAGSPSGTFVNDQPVKGQVLLHSGDLIRIGKSQLRFGERQKRTNEE